MNQRLSLFELLLLAAFTALCHAQTRGYDRSRLPACRLWRHASVLAGSNIYVDGGNVLLPTDSLSNRSSSSRWQHRGTNHNLLVLDTAKNFTTDDPQVFKAIRKTDLNVPRTLNQHALWFSKPANKIYQLGGWASYIGSDKERGYGSTAVEIPSAAIWEYDLTSEKWAKADDSFELRHKGDKVERAGAAAYCDVPSLGLNFMFGGYVQHRSDKDYASFSSFDAKYLSGMLALDTNSGLKPRLTNISTPRSLDGVTQFGPRMNGGMVHVPVGDKGILVQVGGRTGEETPIGTKVTDAKIVNIDLSFVDIYDISSGFWFRQQTFGIPDIPSGRSDFCLAAVSAPDGSSHSIYMVSGMDYTITGPDNQAERITKSEIWVLTLPSFNWVLIDNKAQATYGHTCHVVGDNLIVIGGQDSSRGERRGEDAQCPDSSTLINIFSLRTNTYVTEYDAGGATRPPLVPAKVVEAVGGSATGGAHVRSPRIWSDTYLQSVFNPELRRPEYKATYKNADGSEPPGETVYGTIAEQEQSKTRAIVGGVVGGVLGGLLVIAAVVCLVIYLRRRSQKEDEEGGDEEQKLDFIPQQQQFEAELPAYDDKDVLVELAAPPPPSEVEGCPGDALTHRLVTQDLSRSTTISGDSAVLSPQSVGMSQDEALSRTVSGEHAVSAMTAESGSWRQIGSPTLPETTLAVDRQRARAQSVASTTASIRVRAVQNSGFF